MATTKQVIMLSGSLLPWQKKYLPADNPPPDITIDNDGTLDQFNSPGK